MSELFLELFSEEIPAPLQSVARIKLIENIKNFFDKEKITYKGETNCFSTPNRLIVHFKNSMVVENEKLQDTHLRLWNLSLPLTPWYL